MLDGFDNTWGIMRELGVSSVFIFHHLVYFIYTSNTSFFFPAQVHPQINDEQESFIRRVLEIFFE